MAGGTWTAQNKLRPGIYIRFRSVGEQRAAVGERGTVAICRPLSWGPVGELLTVESGMDTTPFTGYGGTDSRNRFLTELFKGSDRTAAPKQVLLYRLAAKGAQAATAQLGEGALTVTARYPGVRGNDITVAVSEDPDSPGHFTVSTLVDGVARDEQRAEAAEGLAANDWVRFGGSGALSATGGLPLAGGTDGTVDSAAYADFLTALEPCAFDVLVYDGGDATVQQAMTAFVRRLAEENGRYAQLVTANMAKPNSRYVINVASGVTLSDGTELTAQQAAWWVGGAQAGALYNQSLTYAEYPGAVAASPKRTDSQIGQGLAQGLFILEAEDGQVRVEQDLNSLTTFTQQAGESFRHNRTMRLSATFANDIYRIFRQGFIGAANNNERGRQSFKARIVGYLLDMEKAEAIQNFSPDDVEVLPGEEINGVEVNVAFQPVGSMEKIYMTVSVR